ncbi:MAG TPA: hypothetical protein VHG89_10565 [Verrucomicrobiae bacterium]|nr:hypothetical protein [Verrucomicrobiae bacterium]
MNDKKIFVKAGKVGFVFAVALLMTLAGCVGPRAEVQVEPYAFAAQDDYVYYPQYECYYSVSRRQYAYREGNIWVARPAPRGIPVNALVASPSVKMNFHDSPVNHHAQVVKQYPKNWKPDGAKQDQSPKDNQHGDNAER